MDTHDPHPPTPSPANTPTLALVVAVIVLASVAVAVITGLTARQSTRESARLEAAVATVQKDLDALRSQVRNLTANSDRTAVLPLAEPVYFPVRTNGGTLLLAVAHVERVGNGLRLYLSVGNPHAMTYKGFTLAFAWDQGKGTQAFADALAPGTWTGVQVMLSPADPASTKSLTITSATVDQIPVQ